MQGSVTVAAYCPRMAVNTISRKLHRTADEPVDITLTMPDGSILKMAGDIPETNVRFQHFLNWLVDPCECTAGDAAGNAFIIELVPEVVSFDWWTARMVARKIDCRATLRMADGSVATGIATFDDCPVALGWPTSYASPTTAHGTLTFQ